MCVTVSTSVLHDFMWNVQVQVYAEKVLSGPLNGNPKINLQKVHKCLETSERHILVTRGA